MAEERDVLFRIGFTDHPQASEALAALAKGVEAAQGAMSDSINAVGVSARNELQELQRIIQTGRDSAKSGGSASPSVSVGSDGGRAIEDSIGMLDELATARRRDVDSMKARIESMRLFAEVEKTLSQEATALVIEGMAQMEAAVRDSLDIIKQVHNGKLVDEGALANAQRILADYYDTVKQAKENADKDSRQAIEAERKEFAEAVSMKKELMDSYRSHVTKIAEETRAIDAAKAEAANKAFAESVNTRIELMDAVKEQAKKTAEAETKAFAEAVSMQKELRDSMRTFAEETAKAERDAAQKSSKEYIEAYRIQEKAAREAETQIRQGNQRIEQSATGVATGVGRVVRASALLGFASGDATDKALQKLAKVQAVIDLIAGSYRLLKSVSTGMDALRMVVEGKAAASLADAEATKVATTASETLAKSIADETLTLKENIAAHEMRNKAMAGGGKSGGGGKVPNQTSGGGTVKSKVTDSQDKLTEAIKNSTTVTKLQTRALSMLDKAKSAGGSVAKKAATTAASVASRVATSAVGVAVGAMVTTFAASAATALAAAGATAMAIATSPITASLAAFAGVVAVGSAAVYAANKAWSAAKSLYEGGISGLAEKAKSLAAWFASLGSSAGSWVAEIGIAISDWAGAFDIVGNLAVAEAESRIALFDVEKQRKMDHLDKLEAIELDRAAKLRDISEKYAAKTFEIDKMAASSPDEKLGLIGSEIENTTKALATLNAEHQSRMAELIEKEETLAKLASSENRLAPNKELVKLRKDEKDIIDEINAARAAGDKQAESEANSRLAKNYAAQDGVADSEVEKALIAARAESAQALSQYTDKHNEYVERRVELEKEVLDVTKQVLQEESQRAIQEAQNHNRKMQNIAKEIERIDERVKRERDGIAKIIQDKRDANKAAIEKAQANFADMSAGERERLKSVVERARGGDRDFNKKDRELLGKLETDESKKFLREANAQQAQQFGMGGLIDELTKKRDVLANDETAESTLTDKEKSGLDAAISEQAELQAKQSEHLATVIEKYGGNLEAYTAKIQASLGSFESKFEVVNVDEIRLKFEESAALKAKEIAAIVRQVYDEGKEKEFDLVNQTNQQLRQAQERAAKLAASKRSAG